MDHNAACWTPVTAEEMLHNAAFAKCMKALCDGGGIDEKTAAKGTSDVWIKLIERQLGLVVRVAV